MMQVGVVKFVKLVKTEEIVRGDEKLITGLIFDEFIVATEDRLELLSSDPEVLNVADKLEGKLADGQPMRQLNFIAVASELCIEGSLR